MQPISLPNTTHPTCSTTSAEDFTGAWKGAQKEPKIRQIEAPRRRAALLKGETEEAPTAAQPQNRRPDGDKLIANGFHNFDFFT